MSVQTGDSLINHTSLMCGRQTTASTESSEFVSTFHFRKVII